ncbi:protein translocase subunit SecF [Hypericibacter sp.]|uniref:protein translocase subunit SecF n=1 Tax=Hypericibacter sp. TaxID=2705401 RepID=UPI003D6D1178
MFGGIHLVRHDTRIDFMRIHKPLMILSILLVLGSILLVATKGLNYGIDFRGGILMEVRTTDGPADLAGMREKLTELGLGEVYLQQFGSPQDVLIRLRQQEGGDAAQGAAVQKVKDTLGTTVEYRRTETVGPKVGSELITTAIYATLLALVGIAAYIWFRYEWQFGLNAILATFHDVITTVGMFSLLGLQFDLVSVAAVLTIAGYSVNDTVVIYDRIRDELRRYKKLPISDIINQSINKTLARTTVTSGLTLLSVLAIALFGGEALRGFAIALIWGILIGTYSTIFVASPMLIYMNLRGIRAKAVTAPADPAAASAPAKPK